MQLRASSMPLITVDPYFSVWSPADKLTDTVTEHWTGKPNTILGTAEIDGTAYRFMGKLHAKDETSAMKQIRRDCDALSTTAFAMGLSEGMELINSLPDVWAVFVTEDMELHYSEGFEERFG